MEPTAEPNGPDYDQAIAELAAVKTAAAEAGHDAGVEAFDPCAQYHTYRPALEAACVVVQRLPHGGVIAHAIQVAIAAADAGCEAAAEEE